MTEPVRIQTAEALWKDYSFLTRELSKFADRQEWDMFLNLLEQRAALQKLIDAQADKKFAVSAIGRSLLGGILQEEEAIARRIRLLRNQAQNKQKISQAYDAFSVIPSGSLINRGT